MVSFSASYFDADVFEPNNSPYIYTIYIQNIAKSIKNWPTRNDPPQLFFDELLFFQVLIQNGFRDAGSLEIKSLKGFQSCQTRIVFWGRG